MNYDSGPLPCSLLFQASAHLCASHLDLKGYSAPSLPTAGLSCLGPVVRANASEKWRTRGIKLLVSSSLRDIDCWVSRPSWSYNGVHGGVGRGTERSHIAPTPSSGMAATLGLVTRFGSASSGEMGVGQLRGAGVDSATGLSVCM